MIIVLQKLNNLKNIKLEFMNEIVTVYGITQNPETKDYIKILDNKCKICNNICYSIHFQQNFNNWTSGNDDIDKFIQNIQLSSHNILKKALEWILYDKFYNIKYIGENKYSANWIDGNMYYWDGSIQNWMRRDQNMIVILKKLNNTKDIALEFINRIKTDYKYYGITQNSETKNYMVILREKCKTCNYICYSIHFQQNFYNWTSGNDDIDKFIQDIQLSVHRNIKEVLEWIPYDRFCDIKYIAEDRYQANWIDGKIWYWNSENENWARSQYMIVVLKKLNNPINVKLEFMNEV
ncbi:hypothetical protein RhiirC2_801263 [Rhizophagus irregularis]|uniref:Uncharacterized protein n=1 Tax=Rhizophagus irregularis TaxID=588596 RepID=A0A2N1M2J5_9GLOM|nr:hypothetical protein RhiirC2_801263 [Rhizophagus irregularis]